MEGEFVGLVKRLAGKKKKDWQEITKHKKEIFNLWTLKAILTVLIIMVLHVHNIPKLLKLYSLYT